MVEIPESFSCCTFSALAFKVSNSCCLCVDNLLCSETANLLSVLVTLEGERDTINAFIENLSNTMSGYIGDARIEWQPVTGEFDSFHIKF